MDKVQACRRKAILAPRFLRAVTSGRSPVAHRKPTLTVLVTKGTYVMNTGDTAWVLVATRPILFMTLPSLAMGSSAIGVPDVLTDQSFGGIFSTVTVAVLALKDLRSSGLSVCGSSLGRPDRFYRSHVYEGPWSARARSCSGSGRRSARRPIGCGPIAKRRW